MSVTLLIISIPILILSYVYLYSKRKFSYWQKQNVIHPKPVPILGNYGDYILLRKYVGQTTQEICQEFPNAPYIGAFYGTEPTLIVQSLELIKLITTKDYYYFSSREVSNYTHNEVFTQNMFFTYGDRWKVLRQNLTPLFSSAKMKKMFYLIENCAHVFENLIDDEVETSNVIEARALMSRYTMDCIGSCVFGVEADAMGKDKNNPFRKMGNLIFEISNRRGLSLIGRSIWPAIFYGLRLKTFPDELFKFFNKLLIDVFKARNYESSNRHDFVDQVLGLKKNKCITGDSITNLKTGGNKKVSLETDDELLVAQCLVFFAAGFETSATTTSFTLYELAKNQEAQRRAIKEVDAYLQKHGNKLDYNCVTELPYLEACVDEALRFYPVVGTLTREVVEDYTLPDGVKLEKGVRVHLPVYHLQLHPDHFPDPLQYRPERFFGDARQNVKQYTYMPFGEGPRLCIGMRFAKMLVLSGLVTLFKKYRVELAEGMPLTVKLEPRGLITQPARGLDLRFVERSGWEQRLLAR